MLEVVWELSVFVSDHLIDLLLVESCGPSQIGPSQVGEELGAQQQLAHH